jgi:hypothetical protein
VTITAADEVPRQDPGATAGFSEAVTFAFGDPARNVFGIARLGLAGAPGADRTASGLALLFAAGEPVAVRADGGLAAGADPAWETLDVAGVQTTIDQPLRSWTVTFGDEDGASGFTLTYTACSHPTELPAGDPAATAGGMQGYEQLCRVTGTARVGGQELRVDCLGQRGRSWGAPDWGKIGLARTVSGWLGEDLGFSLTAIRSARAAHHADEALAAFLIAPVVAPTEDPDAPAEDPDAPVIPAAAEPVDGLTEATLVEDPRLSTTYDGEDRQRRAGLELYVREQDAVPRRIAGEVLCGTSLDLGRLRLDTAFFVWRTEGREGVGRYDIIRHAA